ncbi:MAG: SOS response-associated peptidase [Alphaproteobacteria bacterium]|nr:SOS response-associated peptidase [Alphaproteobacteria bacterium]
MCGRYTHRLSWREIHDLYRLTDTVAAPNLEPRYNMAPQQRAPVVRTMAAGGRELAFARWGLVPAWSKEPRTTYSTINARAETVATKPAFRDAFRHRRCLVPASGWYEWEDRPDGKQPWLYARADGGVLTFAGLWERWGPRDDKPALDSFTIIVCGANPLAADKHDRMPAILRPADFDAWLDGSSGDALLRPWPDDDLVARPVSRRVNSVRNDDAECIDGA